MSRRLGRAALVLFLALLLCLTGQAAPQAPASLPVVADADFVFDRAIPPLRPRPGRVVQRCGVYR